VAEAERDGIQIRRDDLLLMQPAIDPLDPKG